MWGCHRTFLLLTSRARRSSCASQLQQRCSTAYGYCIISRAILMPRTSQPPEGDLGRHGDENRHGDAERDYSAPVAASPCPCTAAPGARGAEVRRCRGLVISVAAWSFAAH